MIEFCEAWLFGARNDASHVHVLRLITDFIGKVETHHRYQAAGCSCPLNLHPFNSEEINIESEPIVALIMSVNEESSWYGSLECP